jgi:hypothetical protein
MEGTQQQSMTTCKAIGDAVFPKRRVQGRSSEILGGPAEPSDYLTFMDTQRFQVINGMADGTHRPAQAYRRGTGIEEQSHRLGRATAPSLCNRKLDDGLTTDPQRSCSALGSICMFNGFLTCERG